MALHERAFFTERPESRPATFTCPRRDYLIRVDDNAVCPRCRRNFDVPSHQSMVFL